MLDHRYIYLGSTTAKHLYKIGIATDPAWRWRDIDESVIGSKERLLCAFRVYFAYNVEQWFHARYRRYNRQFKGSGKTEWFALPLYRLAEVLLLMVAIWALCKVSELLTALCVLLMLYAIGGIENMGV